MKILAVDSSGLTASAAVVTENNLLAEYTVNYKKTHSQTLLPMIDMIVGMLELDLNTLDAIAVSAGPGSFTGLRIGSATVKGLGLVLKKPVIGVPTIDALAYNLYGYTGLICPLMDARRNEVYTGLYTFKENRLTIIEKQMAVGIKEILKKVNDSESNVIFLGDGTEPYMNQIKEYVKVPFSFAPPHLLKQRAGAVGSLAVQYFIEGKIETADEFKPVYLRLSQAERELIQKNGNMNGS